MDDGEIDRAVGKGKSAAANTRRGVGTRGAGGETGTEGL
jgi:hypothetical protein